MLFNLERKDPPMTIEEIREESEEGDVMSPLQSGSNTDRIFSEPVTDDGKKRVRSPTFPVVKLDDQKPIKEGEESELSKRTPDLKATEPEPETQPQLSPKTKTGSKIRPRMALSSEKSRDFNRKLSIEDNDSKAIQLSAAARLSAVVKQNRRSIKEHSTDISDNLIALRLRSLKESLEGPNAINRRLEIESSERQKSNKEVRKPSVEPFKSHLIASQRIKSIKSIIDKINSDQINLNSTTATEGNRDRRSLIVPSRSFRPMVLPGKRKATLFASNAPLAPVKEEEGPPKKQSKKYPLSMSSLFNGFSKRVSIQ